MAGFDWDPFKAARNVREHGIRFEDAIDVFDDPRAVTEDDPDPDEERFEIVGMMAGSVVTVTFYRAWRRHGQDHIGSKGHEA
jgi:uncharacterized DUF497 family protein